VSDDRVFYNTGKNQVPNDLDAECAVLGSILIDPQKIHLIAPILRAADFYSLRNVYVYEALVAIEARGDPIDFVTVIGELSAAGRLEAVRGAVYISELVDSVASALNIESYARRVADCATRRDLLGAATKAVKLAYDESRPLSEVVVGAEAAIYAVRRDDAASALKSAAVASRDLSELFDRIRAGDMDAGIHCGYDDIARRLMLRRQELTLIAARPGVGKTALLLNIALKVATQGRRVLFFSAEMSYLQLWKRALRTLGVMNHPPSARDSDLPGIADGLKQLAGLPLYIDDTSRIGVVDMRSRAIRVASEQQIDLILCDYVQIMKPPPGMRRAQRYEEVGAISLAIRDLGRELDCHVMAGAQIARDSAHREPVLSDLRESGSLEQDSDNVLFLHPIDSGNATQQFVEAIIAKQRNGPSDGPSDVRAVLAWHPRRTAFTTAKRRRPGTSVL